MNGVLGNPSGFTVMLYADGVLAGGVIPGSSLGALNGSLDPAASGTYTFTPAANLTLSRFTPYFIVLTAGTAISDGAYNWSLAGANSYNPSGGWGTLAAYCSRGQPIAKQVSVLHEGGRRVAWGGLTRRWQMAYGKWSGRAAGYTPLNRQGFRSG
jgi:hypothetical protein